MWHSHYTKRDLEKIFITAEYMYFLPANIQKVVEYRRGRRIEYELIISDNSDKQPFLLPEEVKNTYKGSWRNIKLVKSFDKGVLVVE